VPSDHQAMMLDTFTIAPPCPIACATACAIQPESIEDGHGGTVAELILLNKHLFVAPI
jgi:hypothetical protein